MFPHSSLPFDQSHMLNSCAFNQEPQHKKNNHWGKTQTHIQLQGTLLATCWNRHLAATPSRRERTSEAISHKTRPSLRKTTNTTVELAHSSLTSACAAQRFREDEQPPFFSHPPSRGRSLRSGRHVFVYRSRETGGAVAYRHSG